MSDAFQALQARVTEAAEKKRPLRIRGGGSKDFYGRAAAGDRLDTRDHSGVVDYEPTELVVTVRCGTPLRELERLLAERGQMLAFEPPHFGAATIGGAIATGLSGPRRATSGAARDFVLGVRVIDGRGRDLSFGGRVMKNVAGYDVSRLIVGSLGTLALIAEVSLKVLPVPPESLTLVREAGEADAIRWMNEWGGKPLPISATCVFGGKLFVRLSGAAPALKAARAHLGGDILSHDAAFWESVREQAHMFFAGTGGLWRISVPSATAPLALGPTLIEWGGAQRWVRTESDTPGVPAAAIKERGHATAFRSRNARDDVFTPLAPALARIHSKLKQEFDPHRIFNPGRMYADL
ncbi:MAG TPA: glycolate oxidase subunit GlcE [Burkholderiaceae bacterium]|nr:glycolate oxidase subunit GlcE [Burkholderiaceae bacterium]